MDSLIILCFFTFLDIYFILKLDFTIQDKSFGFELRMFFVLFHFRIIGCDQEFLYIFHCHANVDSFCVLPAGYRVNLFIFEIWIVMLAQFGLE